jgi:glycosyltransferase involved in cell wall biosynthesis
MATVSAVINTRNEEKNIRYCLETLKWCDEIVVVDMESEDKTVEIAREYTSNIYTHPIIPAFDSARKFAVEKAIGDWILLIDADELVPKLLCDRLKRVVINNETDIVYIPFKTYIMGAWIKNTGWWPEYHPRFFKRDAVSFTADVHAFMQEDASARKLFLPAIQEVAVWHFNYRDSQHFVEKLNRYTSIEAVQAFVKGKKFSLFRMLAAGFRGFQVRYISQRGYKDGYRGFFLSIMMGFYRTMTYVKLWELWNYSVPVETSYENIKNKIISDYSCNK